MVANTSFVINLNKGDIYEVRGQTSSSDGVEMRGLIIRSNASERPAVKKIAVFSGRGRVRWRPAVPSTVWIICTSNAILRAAGERNICQSHSKNNAFNYYRITKNDHAAQVSLNGVRIPASSFINHLLSIFLTIPN